MEILENFVAFSEYKNFKMRRENTFKKTRQKQIINIPFGLGVGFEAKFQDGYEHGQD